MNREKRGVGVVTDQERREDEALKNCIVEAYGCTDEDILAELEEIEATLSESDFPGIEERAYQKLMARIAEEEEVKAAEETVEKVTEIPAEVKVDPKIESSTDETDGKVVRIGKKKVLMVAVLAAAFVGALGVTAIGGKSYFFRGMNKNDVKVTFDNDKRIVETSNLEDAYQEIKKELGEGILKLEYIPEGMKFDKLVLDADKAIISFQYNDNIIYFIQIVREEGAALGVSSDRKIEGIVDNVWVNKHIEYGKNVLDNGKGEFEAQFAIDNRIYRLFGIMDEDEFIKIIKFINFY